MNFIVTKQGALFALMLIVALFAYLYITSPMLEFIKVLGCALSALLFCIAMQARVCKRINTTQLGADWALLFVGACGQSNELYLLDDKPGGGTFVYDATKSTINDGGLVINGWARQLDNPKLIDVSYFGGIYTTFFNRQ